MKYTVLRYFTDLQDNNYAYRAGDTYPRKGMSPSTERIEELASDKNKQHTPLIKAVSEISEAEKLEKPEKPKRKRKGEE